eukprot:snap_masked-scaffold_3-processed-gene-21.79-mRNA-1 protein AED:1.00 eAED:1.00 QI:0/-1/0/0/-1/1/1/0/271
MLTSVNCSLEMNGTRDDRLVPKKEKNICESCEQRVAIYCCPACKRFTCSLTCVRAHKIKENCPGLKKKEWGWSERVDKKSLSLDDIVNDYEFLKEVNNFRDAAERETQDIPHGAVSRKRGRSFCSNEYFNERGRRWKKLKSILAENSRKTRILYLPLGMTRQKRNKIKFNIVEGIFWTLELVLCRNGVKKDPVYVSGVSEKSSIKEVLKVFSRAGESMKVFLVNENEETMKSQRFIELTEAFDQDCSLRCILRHKTIIEFPTFRVEIKTKE